MAGVWTKDELSMELRLTQDLFVTFFSYFSIDLNQTEFLSNRPETNSTRLVNIFFPIHLINFAKDKVDL